MKGMAEHSLKKKHAANTAFSIVTVVGEIVLIWQ
jgi:hypothetical protein